MHKYIPIVSSFFPLRGYYKILTLCSIICSCCLSILYVVQFSSVTQLCQTLCDPMNRSTPGLPVHHQLPESTQTHVHRVSDAIQPSHPLSSPIPPAPILPRIRVFSNGSTLRMRWPKYWSFSFNTSPSNEHPGLISFICSSVCLLIPHSVLPFLSPLV